MSTEKGVKLDNGKNRLGLVFDGFSNALWQVGEVGTFGANKYTDNGWQSVEKGQKRYVSALLRHLFKHFQGEEHDKESNLLHLAHVAWNALAILELYIHNDTVKETRNLDSEKLGQIVSFLNDQTIVDSKLSYIKNTILEIAERQE